MANTSSAQKAARQTVRRTDVNKTRRSRLRSTVRGVEAAIAAGDKAAADRYVQRLRSEFPHVPAGLPGDSTSR